MSRFFKPLALAAVAVTFVSCGQKYEYPFQNPKLSIDKRVENLISLLTPEEKVGLMNNLAAAHHNHANTANACR